LRRSALKVVVNRGPSSARRVAGRSATKSRGWNPIAGTGKTADADLVQLVYVSAAAEHLSADELDAIARQSQENNAVWGLTGLLLHQAAHFYGVLEGPRRRVFARMEKIITDRRHSRLRILREQSIPARRFDNWSFSRLPAPSRTTAAAPAEFIWHLSRRLK
jgi:Sensors of blue-light using FAD